MPEIDSRPQYPIRTAARRTGLSPHVLRAWERRYGAVEPARPGGGPRLYSDADILRFRLLRQLVDAGHGIGTVARLPAPELVGLLRREEGRAPELPAAGPADRLVGGALSALEGMDGRRLHATLMQAVVALSAQDFVDEVALPLLRRVGQLWAEGEICPAHEHLLSVQLGRVLGWLSDTIPVPESAPGAVAVAPAGQRHEFGALLAGVVAAEEGWRVTYLGADLPAPDIAAAVEARGAEVLLLSVVIEGTPSALAADLREIRDAVGEGVEILVGGRGAEPLRTEIRRTGGRWLPDLAALRAALRELRPALEAR